MGAFCRASNNFLFTTSQKLELHRYERSDRTLRSGLLALLLGAMFATRNNYASTSWLSSQKGPPGESPQGVGVPGGQRHRSVAFQIGGSPKASSGNPQSGAGEDLRS